MLVTNVEGEGGVGGVGSYRRGTMGLLFSKLFKLLLEEDALKVAYPRVGGGVELLLLVALTLRKGGGGGVRLLVVGVDGKLYGDGEVIVEGIQYPGILLLLMIS